MATKDDYIRYWESQGISLADLVPVVRCKDCKHYNAGFECLIDGYGIERPQTWYCADGERKDEVDE